MCFLLLAALVGMSASLDEGKLAAIGERLVALQSDIAENSTYQPLTHAQAAGAKVAYDYEYSTGAPYGPLNEGSFNWSAEPQTSYNYDVPSNYNYYQTQPLWDSDVSAPFDYSAYPVAPQGGSWDSDVSAPFDYAAFDRNQYPGNVPTAWESGEYNIDYGTIQTVPTQFDGGYGTQIDWNAAFPEAQVSAAPAKLDYGYTPAGAPPASGNAVIGQGPDRAPSYYGSPVTYTTNLTTIQRNDLSIYNNLTITERQNYALGLAPAYTTYQPTWYERAFPGWGTAVIPLLPPQYQPNYGYGNYGYNNVSLYGSGYYGSQIQPTCSITLGDTAINYGESAELKWRAYDATAATLNGIGSVPITGGRTIGNQTVSRTFGLTVYGPGGTGACYVALAVAPRPRPLR